MTGTSWELDDLRYAWTGSETLADAYDHDFPEAIARHQAIARHVRRRMARAWRSMQEAHPREAMELADWVANQLGQLDDATAERYRAQVRLIRGFGKVLSDDPAGLLLELSSGAGDSERGRLRCALLRFGYWRLSRWSDLHALPVPRTTVAPCDALASIIDRVVLADAAIERLRLITASRFATDAMNIARATGLGCSIGAAAAATVLATVQYELGYLDHAEQLILSALPIVRMQGTPDLVIRTHLTLTRIAQHRGHNEHAAVLLHEGQLLGERMSCVRITLTMMAERVRLLLLQQNVARAREEASEMARLAKEHRAAPLVQREVASVCMLAQLQIALVEQRHAHAIEALRTLIGAARSTHRRYTAFRLTLELLGALNESGDTQATNRLLVRSLRTAEGAGLLQSWIDAHPGCSTLLERVTTESLDASSQPPAHLDPYVRTLLAHVDASKRPHALSKRRQTKTSQHLSVQERLVLALIARGQSNKRVAQTLKVTPETIKSHLKRVFVKLGARTRAEAVTRAADLGQLLDAAVSIGAGQACPRS